VFQLAKLYGAGFELYRRVIRKPVAGTVKIAVDGTAKTEGAHFTVDSTSGAVTFQAGHIPPAGAAVTAGFEFDVPVRFDTDKLEINLLSFEHGTIPSIPILEVRL
jgi:uncharacterized protein (TIGR02217 family)